MNKIFLCLFLICGAIQTNCQDKRIFSTEINTSYIYYFVGENKKNDFNYGFSILLSSSLNSFKISAGVAYSLKSYESAENLYITLDKRRYNLDYLHVPILFSYKFVSHKSYSSSIVMGIIFNHILDYDIRSYYTSGDFFDQDISSEDQKLGASFNLGFQISKIMCNKISINLSPFIYYVGFPDHYDQGNDYRNFPNDRISLRINVGIEYYLNSE